MSEPLPMWVCAGERCYCHEGEDPYSCDCTAIHVVGRDQGMCVHCLEPMVLIDAHTGDRLQSAVS